MKLKELIYGLWTSCKIIFRFCRQHHDALTVMQGTYVKQPLHDKLIAGLDTTLTITSYGSLYHITRKDFINDEPAQEKTWLATYGWHSNGHLIEIGGDRYCILDTVAKSLYLEELTESGTTTIELFTKSY